MNHRFQRRDRALDMKRTDQDLKVEAVFVVSSKGQL